MNCNLGHIARRACFLAVAYAVGIASSPSSIMYGAPILEYKFNETGNTAPSTGTDTTSVGFGTNNAGAGYTQPADLHGAAGSGVSGLAADRAFDNTASTHMGSLATAVPNGGGVAIHAGDNNNVDDLQSFSAMGWFKSSSVFSDGARWISSRETGGSGNGFSLFAGGTPGTLSVIVDNINVTTASPFFNETDKWVFFAVTYDGTATSNNLIVYRGYRNLAEAGANPLFDDVAVLSVNEDGDGDIDQDSAFFAIGNSNLSETTHSRRAYDGLLDNIRVFGADTGAGGVLSESDLNVIRAADALVPEPTSFSLVVASGLCFAGLARRLRRV